MAGLLTTKCSAFTPAAAAGTTLTTGASTWANGAYVELIASTATVTSLMGWVLEAPSTNAWYEVELATGDAGAETPLATVKSYVAPVSGAPYAAVRFPTPIVIGSGVRVAVRLRTSFSTAQTLNVTLQTIAEDDSDLSTTSGMACVPAASDAVSVTPNNTAWANSAYGELSAGLGSAVQLAAVGFKPGQNNIDYELDIATGDAGAESVVTTLRGFEYGAAGWNWYPLVHPYHLASSVRIAIRVRKGTTGTSNWAFGLMYYTDGGVGFTYFPMTPSEGLPRRRRVVAAYGSR